MKKLFFVLSIFLIAFSAVAQNGVRHKMAIFTPLYLDDAFNADGAYRFSDKAFPKGSIPGLEFYHGALMASDSLKSLNLLLNIYIYDSKSARETLEQQFSKCVANGVELIIANCSINELSKLAKLANDKKIPVINATVPNDGNAINNPYFVVLNSTLGTQVEGIYNYVKANHPGKELIFFTHSGGTSEKYIKSVFETLIKKSNSNFVPVRYVEIGDTVAVSRAIYAQPKDQPALFLSGSLDLNFGANALKMVSAASKDFPRVTVIGMPTWENIGFSKPEYKDVEIIYSTPFYNPKTDAISKNIAAAYNKKMYSRPSDLVYRAFGLTYSFGRLLNQYGKNIKNNLGSKEYQTFFDYDIQPVYGNGKLNYYENKKLYFLKYLNGTLQQVM